MKNSYLFIALILLFSCNSRKSNDKRIDIKSINASYFDVATPKWDELIRRGNSEYFVINSIHNESTYDSIVYFVKRLKPMPKDCILEECYTYLQCTVHYADGLQSILLVGRNCISLDGVVMLDNDSLVNIVNRNTGVAHLRW